MGTLYLAFPLNDEVTMEWLDKEGVPHPPASTAFRFPTPREIECVLAGLCDYTYEVRRDLETGTWYANAVWKDDPSNGPWTEIAICDYRDDDLPDRFHFTKGWQEVIFLIAEHLTHICGPLAIADGSSAIPYLVMPGATVSTMIDEYNRR